MNTCCKVIIIIVVINLYGIVVAAQTKNNLFTDQKKLIKPDLLFGDKQFFEREFVSIGSGEREEDTLRKMSNARPFGVDIVNDKFVVKEILQENTEFSFDLEDGKLEVINKGEFGGKMSFVPNNNPSKKKIIFEGNVNFVFEFQGGIYFTTGLSHLLRDTNNALYELVRENNVFSFVKWLNLDSATQAITIHKDRIFLAGSRTFTVIERSLSRYFLQKLFLISIENWWGLYPNSIAVKNKDEIYVGMRGGYTKISLPCKEIEYFRHIEN